MVDPIHEFVQKQLECMEIEHQKEMEEELTYLHAFSDVHLQKKGICLVELRVTGVRTGLGGKV
jgi:DNA polymerase alpha-associated DNA helicase A